MFAEPEDGGSVFEVYDLQYLSCTAVIAWALVTGINLANYILAFPG